MCFMLSCLNLIRLLVYFVTERQKKEEGSSRPADEVKCLCHMLGGRREQKQIHPGPNSPKQNKNLFVVLFLTSCDIIRSYKTNTGTRRTHHVSVSIRL